MNEKEMSNALAGEVLSSIILTNSHYCDSGLYMGKYFVEMKGYITPAQLNYLQNLPPIERIPPIQIKE